MEKKYSIPRIRAKGDLSKSLLINIIGGFWGVLGKEGINYFRLLSILIDKAVYEYNILYEYLEIESKKMIVYHIG